MFFRKKKQKKESSSTNESRMKFSIFKPFEMNRKRQEKVYNQIKAFSEGDFDFYIMSLFAGIIITLGLLVDSGPVVIGGMLLAPLVWPILAMAIGITMGRSRLIEVSVFTLLKSMLVIIAVAVVVGFIIPELTIVNSEILSRTSPTLVEFLIGLAAGFIAAFIVSYPKMGSSIAGVAIAAAIVPPIATIGISLGRGDFEGMAGAFLLFLSNLVAITFAASILFLISNYAQSGELAEERRLSGFKWTMLLLVIVVIPLIFLTFDTRSNVKQQRIITDVVHSSIENSEISELILKEQNDVLTINLTLRSSQNISQLEVAAVENVISKRLDKQVITKIKVIPVVEAGQDWIDELHKYTDEQLEEIKKQIEQNENKDFEQVLKNKLENNFIECSVILNETKLNRLYPNSVGCPVCPKIQSCGDGREIPVQNYDEEKGECVDLVFVADPCRVGNNEQ